VGGAIFKSFKAVTIQGTAIGFLAQLASGTTEKVAAGNDMGVWIKDGSNALALAVREGDKRSGKTIDTLVSFAGGNGSAGQGRGWITVHGSAFALALAKFTDKTWGIINAEPGAGGDVNIDTQTLVKGTPTSPALAGASFASLSFPAQNSAIASTFLGTLAAGTGPVTKADAQAIFTSAVNTEGGPYGILARQGQPASGTGANFNILKDPVLAEDGGIAFTATIKGGTIKAPADTGIWWQPPAGGALTLFAQGGKRPSTDLNDNAQWKSFGSLAIASGRGPIFTGTLATGPGGVKATDANGVWACDFTGNVRLAFRTGIPDAIVTGKTLKSFTLLTGSVGSTGVTRSFNNVGEVVWLATFTNGQTALVRTTVP
jgi:hypothetical protein